MNITFNAYCPLCRKTVSAALVRGSLEELQQGAGQVQVGHPTDDPTVGDHNWMLDAQSAANLRKQIDEGFYR
jgi:hypothetical protein